MLCGEKKDDTLSTHTLRLVQVPSGDPSTLEAQDGDMGRDPVLCSTSSSSLKTGDPVSLIHPSGTHQQTSPSMEHLSRAFFLEEPSLPAGVLVFFCFLAFYCESGLRACLQRDHFCSLPFPTGHQVLMIPARASVRLVLSFKGPPAVAGCLSVVSFPS